MGYNKNYSIMILEKEYELLSKLLNESEIKSDIEHIKKVKGMLKQLNNSIEILDGSQNVPCINCGEICDCIY